MKRLIVLLIVLLACSTSALWAADYGDDAGFFIGLDPVGFLTIGPSVEMGGIVADSSQIGVRLRLPALGVLMQVLTKEAAGSTFDDQWMMPWSFGVDVMYTYRLRLSDHHGIYFGGSIGIQMSWIHNYWYDSNSPYYRYYDSWHIPVMGLVGYELDPIGDVYFRFGGMAGAAIGIVETAHRESSGLPDETYMPDTYFIGTLQVIIGWRL